MSLDAAATNGDHDGDDRNDDGDRLMVMPWQPGWWGWFLSSGKCPQIRWNHSMCIYGCDRMISFCLFCCWCSHNSHQWEWQRFDTRYWDALACHTFPSSSGWQSTGVSVPTIRSQIVHFLHRKLPVLSPQRPTIQLSWLALHFFVERSSWSQQICQQSLITSSDLDQWGRG